MINKYYCKIVFLAIVRTLYIYKKNTLYALKKQFDIE